MSKKIALQYGIVVLFLLLGSCIAVLQLNEYIIWSDTRVIAILLFLAISTINTKKSANTLLLFLACLLLFIYYTTQITSILFIAILIILCEGFSLLVGRIHYQFYILLLLCSPLFVYVNHVIGFPLRLQLTKLAAIVLHSIDDSITAIGNQIYVQQEVIAVDEACAGINMLLASYLIAILFIELLQRKYKKEIHIIYYIVIYSASFLLNLGSNLFRIIILTFFKVMPNNIWHEWIGIVCFFIYCCLPLLWLIQFIFMKYAIAVQASSSTTYRTIPKLKFFSTIIAMMLLLIIPQVTAKQQIITQHSINFISDETFTVNQLKDGITQYSNKNSLVYIKPLKHSFSSEHNPLFCWKGSGYELHHFQEIKINNNNIYIGELQKGKNKLYTAWYYSNGNQITNSQWQWRWNNLKNNDKYYLVNLSATTKEELLKQLNYQI